MSELAVAIAMALALGVQPGKAKPPAPAIERNTPSKAAQVAAPPCAPERKLKERCAPQPPAPVAGS